jgi:hypothetical protein
MTAENRSGMPKKRAERLKTRLQDVYEDTRNVSVAEERLMLKSEYRA